MVYRVLGLMSGSSLDGLDMALVALEESGGNWKYTVLKADCKPYPPELNKKLAASTSLNAIEYLELDVALGQTIGEMVNSFIEDNDFQHQIQLIALHGHTTFHQPKKGISAWLGNAAHVAAITRINVVSDLRAIDVALGGQGAPIVPMGEKLLFTNYRYFLNIGGIANLTQLTPARNKAFDICPANKVLNMLANKKGLAYDKNGLIAEAGKVNTSLLTALNKLNYYQQDFPKSLSNDFGIEIVFPMVDAAPISLEDKLRTYIEHIAMQIAYGLQNASGGNLANETLFVTGGGAHNTFLISRLSQILKSLEVTVYIPDDQTVNYKEAIVMALLALLRWREENTVLNEITGAVRPSIGGAVWIGQDY